MHRSEVQEERCEETPILMSSKNKRRFEGAQLVQRYVAPTAEEEFDGKSEEV